MITLLVASSAVANTAVVAGAGFPVPIPALLLLLPLWSTVAGGILCSLLVTNPVETNVAVVGFWLLLMFMQLREAQQKRVLG